jgi:hypothetical protein
MRGRILKHGRTCHLAGSEMKHDSVCDGARPGMRGGDAILFGESAVASAMIERSPGPGLCLQRHTILIRVSRMYTIITSCWERPKRIRPHLHGPPLSPDHRISHAPLDLHHATISVSLRFVLPCLVSHSNPDDNLMSLTVFWALRLVSAGNFAGHPRSIREVGYLRRRRPCGDRGKSRMI